MADAKHLPAMSDQLPKLMAMIRHDLYQEPLGPDGRYQTRTLSLRQLTAETGAALSRTLGTRTDLPILIVSWGKCRTGATPLTCLVGMAGIPAYHQPVKTTARYLLLDSSPPEWHPPVETDQPVIYCREMAGPYVRAETIFNPLEMLLQAGWPASRLRLLILERHPHEALASWFAKWPDKRPRQQLLDHFVLSSLQLPRMENFAQQHDIPVTHYVYEASRRPTESIQALFRALRLSDRFHSGLVSAADDQGAMESQVIFPPEPDIYDVPVRPGADRPYVFKGRDTSGLTRNELDLVEQHGLMNIYSGAVRDCITDLNLDAGFARDVFGKFADDGGVPG